MLDTATVTGMDVKQLGGTTTITVNKMPLGKP